MPRIFSPNEGLEATVYCGNERDTAASLLWELETVQRLSVATPQPNMPLACGCGDVKQAMICEIVN